MRQSKLFGKKERNHQMFEAMKARLAAFVAAKAQARAEQAMKAAIFSTLTAGITRDDPRPALAAAAEAQARAERAKAYAAKTQSALERLKDRRQETVQQPIAHHDDSVSESSVCDICSQEVLRPDGYLLTTREVVSTAAYWQHYYQHHKSELAGMGVSSFADFCGNLLVRTSCAEALVRQSTPWMVCEECIQMFTVNRDQTQSYAKQWWESGRTFAPPGSGPAALSSVNMGDDKSMLSTEQARSGQPEIKGQMEVDTRIRTWCQELSEIHRRHYVSQNTTANTERANRDMEAIGRVIHQAGGESLMVQVCNALDYSFLQESCARAWRKILDERPKPPKPEEKTRPCPLCKAQLPKELFIEGECACPSCKGTFTVEYQ